MSSFEAKDNPSNVRRKLEIGAAEGFDFISEQGTLAIDKLRLVGVYDDRQEGYFMLRTRIPAGRLTAEQAGVLGAVAEEFGKKPAGHDDTPEQFIEITTRQDIQIHWLKIESLPEIWKRYDNVGLTSLQACGNTTRNVTGCPVSGLDPEEILDSYPLVRSLTDFLIENPEYGASLPRKFKIAISGCREDCILARINDLAFTAAENDQGEKGFNVHVGGGLSDYPRLGSNLNVFVSPSQVIEAVRACISVYKDLGDYAHMAANRFRLVVHEFGTQRIRDEFEKRASFTLRYAGRSLVESQRYDHVGVVHQKQKGLVFVGINVPVGRMKGTELQELAQLARKYGNGELRLTQRQNAIIPNVHAVSSSALFSENLLQRFSSAPKPFERAIVACTGAPFCKFAILNTKQSGLDLAERLDQVFDGWKGNPIRIHVSGCKASCAQPQIADIGLRSSASAEEEGLEESYDIGLGGNLAEGKLLNWIEVGVPIPRAEQVIERVLQRYVTEQRDGESFSSFCERIGSTSLKKMFTEV